MLTPTVREMKALFPEQADKTRGKSNLPVPRIQCIPCIAHPLRKPRNVSRQRAVQGPRKNHILTDDVLHSQTPFLDLGRSTEPDYVASLRAMKWKKGLKRNYQVIVRHTE